MKLPIALMASGVLSVATCLSQTMTTGPSTTVEPYLTSALPGVVIESVLTVDDPQPGLPNLVGIPDGMGAFDNGDGTFTLLVNHEINATAGITRAHGNIGSFVSRWVIDKTTREVVSGTDQIQQPYEWDGSQFVAADITFNRLCSADLPAQTAFYNGATGLGSQVRMYMNGEETGGGRAFAHVVEGLGDGNSYYLEDLGYSAWENVVACPVEQDKTILIMTDDSTNGEVYVYVGTKNNTGATEPEKAGLVGGKLYALKIVGKKFESARDQALDFGKLEDITLAPILGPNGERPTDGSETTAYGDNNGAARFGGPEDAAWDTRPGMENVCYFATKGTATGGNVAATRLWKLTFDDIANPEPSAADAKVATLELLLDNPDLRIGSSDNITFHNGKVYIQEDLGGDPRLGRIYCYDTASGTLETVASHNPDFFYAGGSQFLTIDEESSGIIPLESILGAGWFAASVQAHTSTGLSNSGEMVEHGQICFLNLDGRGADYPRETVIPKESDWSYSVNEGDPGPTWFSGGFDASAWSVGPTPIGYSDTGEITTDLAQPPSPRPAANYFRKDFSLGDPSGVAFFELYLKRDDSAVVYLNGVEVARSNTPAGLEITHDSYSAQDSNPEYVWNIVPIVCEDLVLASENTLAVVVLQGDSGSSDMRFDAELIAFMKSPDGPVGAPVQPSGLAATGVATDRIDLSWSSQSDADFFQLERKASDDLVWTVVATDLPGNFAGYSDTGLLEGVEYSYRLAGFNLSGKGALSTTATASTLVNAIPKVFNELFDAGFGQFTNVNLGVQNSGWTEEVGESRILGNGFGADTGSSDDWLIKTDPVPMDFYSDETLEFTLEYDFSGPELFVLYSSDYEPGADPTTFTWNNLATYGSTSGLGEPTGLTLDLSSIPDSAGSIYIAFRYGSAGPGGGQSARVRLYDVCMRGNFAPPKIVPNVDFETDFAGWTTFNISSELTWLVQQLTGQFGAVNNNFGSNAGGIANAIPANDWLVSQAIAIDPSDNATLEFDYYERFGDSIPQPLSVLVSNTYPGGTPDIADWTDITPATLDGSANDEWVEVSPIGIPLTGTVYVAFRYQASGNGGGTTKRIGVDNVCIAKGLANQPLSVGFVVNDPNVTTADTVTFTSSIQNEVGTPAYEWNFGDGTSDTVSGASATHQYTAPGTYTVSLTVTDDNGPVTATETDLVVVIQATELIPSEKTADLRVATFNASLNRDSEGQLVTDLSTPDNAQAKAIAEIIQLVNPDVVLLNEFDFDASNTAVDSFRTNYLEVGQNGLAPVVYAHVYNAPSNTGIQSGFDLNNDGNTGDTGNDAFGFGNFEGQYGMVILSKYPINMDKVRTFQEFLWKDMPDSLLPNGLPAGDFFDPAEVDIFRLSSKSHWDIPVMVDGELVHILASHPTPPVFDDGTDGDLDGFSDADGTTPIFDLNGRRNSDEIRFWRDYVDGAAYIYDDEGNFGGLPANTRFVVMGDQNADADDGDSSGPAILNLLDSPKVNTTFTPESDGADEFIPGSFTNRRTKTSTFNLRADYVLPSVFGLGITDGAVFWPTSSDVRSAKANVTDHRMVYLDLELTAPSLIVTEVHSDEASANTTDFWELTNVGGSPLDISGWAWDDESRLFADATANSTFIPDGTVIAAGESVIITEMDAAAFRAWWALDESVQVISTPNAPGLGRGDGVTLFDAGGNEVLFFTYLGGGFTLIDGTPSVGDEHAGVAAGGSSATASLIIDPAFGFESPRYTFADGLTLGTFPSSIDAADLGSPGFFRFPENGFLVASGDVTATTAVLWAKPNATGEVGFKIASDENLNSVVTMATVSSTDLTIPVKAPIADLTADTEYFYKASSSNGDSARGRFVTPPAAGFNGTSFGVSGDWRGELTPYPAIANVDEFKLDFFVQLGDTIYADDASPASAGFTNPAQAATIGEFRAKHAEVYSDDQFGLGSNNWADLRASTSIFATIDDHEVTNDFAGYQTVASDSRFTAAFPGEPATYINESQLYRNGLQSFAEYNPIREETYSGTGDSRFDGKPKLYRNQTYGRDMQMTVLDARSFRDQAIDPPADFTNIAQVTATYVATFTPGRTMLGQSQLNDLKADLLKAQADGITWKFVSIPEPIQEIFPGVQTDTIAGYAVEKAELLRFIDDNKLTNVVFVAADVHTTFVNNLTWQDSPGGEIKASKAWEITTGSVAYDLPTGEFLAGLAISTLPPEQQAAAAAFYFGLPLAPDTDDVINDKDDFVKDAINRQLLDPFGFDHLGLNDNLPQAEGLIDATLVQGDYFVGHTYGWTKFDIDPETQILTVTTYGMDAYRETEILDPATRDEVLSRPLQIVSQFTVRPQEEEFDGEDPMLQVLSRTTLPLGAEIGAYDPVSKRAFITSGAGLQIVDMTDPKNPAFLNTIDPATFTALGIPSSSVTSVAVGSGPTANLIAASIPGANVTDDGCVLILYSDGTVFACVPTGPLPDMVTFTPDGSKLLIANEGQSAGSENEPLIGPNPPGSVTIYDFSGGVIFPVMKTAGFEAFSDAAALREAGVRVYPGFNFDAQRDLEPEYIAVSADSSTAYVTLQENNAVAVLDLETCEFTAILPLGLKDHSLPGKALDASNLDSGINIRNWPVFGMPMPDAIATHQVDDITYFLTANEGDGRDVDETRIGGLNLDPTVFPDAATLQLDENLGRLKASNVDGDIDGDGDIDQIHTFGARSFSIYDSDGNLVFDSGDDFERITAEMVPDIFNSDGSDPSEFDARSDDKGPEPEGIAVGTISGRTFAFIGLERVGGIMVYDITDVTKPRFVEYRTVPGDIAPEGLKFISAADSPDGTALLMVTNEDSSTMTILSFDFKPFTLELFHLADQEASAAAVEDAPRLSGILNTLRAEDLGNDGLPDNTLTLSSGDAIIPGLFFDASAAIYGSKGIADIQIQNELGIQAMALGNHEFDLGTALIAGLIDGSATGTILGSDFGGTNFPYLSGNLDFDTDTNMAPLVTADHQAPQPNKLAATTVIDVNGEKIGVVAATTPTLGTISSPGTVGITPQPFAGSPSAAELDALAVIIQTDVDALLAADPTIDKVILLAHMQSISIEQELATRLRHVDIIVAGGSNTRLFDANDRIRAGDTNQGTYPIILSDADSHPIAVVNTDGSYKYLGRLVIDFDAAGHIIPASYDEAISGAYATDAQGLADLGAAALIDPEIQTIADEISAQIVATDGNWFGVTNEFLNGNRSGGGTDGVRSQETNLGNLTADANLFAAKAADATVVMSLKNGGGIRASIGQTVVLPGTTEATRIAPTANPLSGRPEGGISENAIKGALAFNNALTLLTLTKEEIVALLEHGVASSTNENSNAPGRFPQVAGVEVSYDLTAPAGDRVVSATIVDGGGNVIAPLVAGGNLVGDPDETFRMVTLSFLADGGDGYPFPSGAGVNRVDLREVGMQTGVATFADNGTEQDALAEYLVANFPAPESAFAQADVTREFDTRLQNLAFRTDSVLDGVPLDFKLWLALNSYSSTGTDSDGNGVDDIVEFFFNQSPNDASDLGNLPVLTAANGDKLLSFTTLDGAEGVTGQLECSLDLGATDSWDNAVEGVDYEVVSSESAEGETRVTLRLLGAAAAKFWRYDVSGS